MTTKSGDCPEDEERLFSKAGEFFGADEYLGEHGAVQAAGVGVAQRGVVAAQDVRAVGQGVFGGVGAARAGDELSECVAAGKCFREQYAGGVKDREPGAGPDEWDRRDRGEGVGAGEWVGRVGGYW